MQSAFSRQMTWVMLLMCWAYYSSGQSNQPVVISAIPYPLYWHNFPAKFSQDNNGLTVLAGPKTDMFRDPNVTYNTDNAPKLLFMSDSDFVLSASIAHGFKTKWDGGAIVLIRDSLNWVKFCFEKDYTGAKRVVSVVTKGISDDCNSVQLSGNKIFYKVAKAGNVITLYYSTDNKSWLLVRHFQFGDDKGLKVGFLAQSPEGEQCEVRFSDFRYEAKRIKDPYLGE